MNLEDARHQKSARAELDAAGPGEARKGRVSGEASTAKQGTDDSGAQGLMEQVVARGNMREALRRVKANQGKPGVDGMTTGKDLTQWLIEHWESVRGQLLAGSYQPQPVRRCEIPKEGGKMRKLGIPTVLDRLVQQAVLQILQPMFDPTFSEHSYGFRPKRRAHDAVRAARRYIAQGKTWVVDVDLESFFDRVNHDILMGKVAKKIGDKRVLKLIRGWLEAGMMADGLLMERKEGTPQGGPLSPLLANVMLDEVDRELEKRKLSFARYADDCNVYVGSERAAQDAMRTLRRIYGRLRLKVNEQKSAIGQPWGRKFLGFSFYRHKGSTRISVAEKSVRKLKDRVREMTSRSGGSPYDYVVRRTLGPYLAGWKGYFQLAQTPKVFARLDGWIRRRVRLLAVVQWENGRNLMRQALALGAPIDMVRPARLLIGRHWKLSNHPAITASLTVNHLKRLGLPTLGSA